MAGVLESVVHSPVGASPLRPSRALALTGAGLSGSGLYLMVVMLAALHWGAGSSSTNAAFTLRPSALHGASGGASMTIPGGTGTLYVTGS